MITILCGKSACGKDTLLKELISNGFIPLISTTTRPMREGEMDGREYNFVTKENFIKNLHNFLEYRTYDTLVGGNPDTWYYGMPKMDLDQDKDYVVILDLGGAKEFIDYYGKENCFTCYVNVPDDIRTKRAMERGSFDETEWNRRLRDDSLKFSDERIKEICVASVDNTDTLKALVYNVEEALDIYKDLMINAELER